MDKSATKTNAYASRTAKSNIRLLAWVITWVATMVLADKAELYGWYSADWVFVLAIIVNAALGLGMIVAFMGYLKVLDEMQRKIQMDALALAMGVTLAGSFTYSLLVTANIVSDVEVSDIILLMVCTYMAGVVIGLVRYR